MKIPFNLPNIAGNEIMYINKAIENHYISGNNHYMLKCYAWLEDMVKCKKALLTHSCTSALEIAAILTDIKPVTCPVN